MLTGSSAAIREMTPADMEDVFRIRVAVGENALTEAQLAEQGITREHTTEMLGGVIKGWVASENGTAVGFSAADWTDASIWALFVLPEFEGRGVGRRLLTPAVEWLWSRGAQRISLTTGPQTRAAGFYRRLGWRENGPADRGDVWYVLDRPESAGDLRVREVRSADREGVVAWLSAAWGDRLIETCGRFVDASRLPGFIAERDGEPAGLLTFELCGGDCEVVTLQAFERRRGVGSALLAAALGAARRAGSRRIWLATTNDNVAALVFYQRLGFRMVAIHRDSITRARAAKPQIPWKGESGIMMRDEIELELGLQRV